MTAAKNVLQQIQERWSQLEPVQRRRLAAGGGVVLLVLVLVVAIGGGGDDEGSDPARGLSPIVKPAFTPTAKAVTGRVSALSDKLDTAVQAGQAGTALATTMTDLSDDARQAVVDLDGTAAPPATAAAAVKRLRSTLRSTAQDLDRLSIASERGNPQDAQRATQALAGHAPQVRSANERLKAAVG